MRNDSQLLQAPPTEIESASKSTTVKFYKCHALLLHNNWLSPAYVGVDSEGSMVSITSQPPQTAQALEFIDGFVLPGFQNAHSHAFQFAMAGLAEKHLDNKHDDFWTWRESMYACALGMEPDQMEKLATTLYVEMLKRGYTHVAEFHYLHHDKNGKPYANLAEMGERLVAAAYTAGIKITLIPVLYQKSNFGKDHLPEQRRFISKTIDAYFHLLDDSAHIVNQYEHATLAFGVHSMRAVHSVDIKRTVSEGPKEIPFHLHAAEQQKEVDDCLAFLKKRPVEWILDNLPVNDRFNLVHCTHMNTDEMQRLASTGANVILCPSTEGNLGDGIFPIADFAKSGGNWCIGTDSQISLKFIEDLRWLDYSQRLRSHKRNTFNDGASLMFQMAIESGRKAMGINRKEHFSIGEKFDAVVYDAKSPLLEKRTVDTILATIIYTSDASQILGTLVNGKWVIKKGARVKKD